MKPIRVNADYELVLAGKNNNPSIINQSLEFLAFFIEERPIFSLKTYSTEYLNYVEEVTGHRPVVTSEGEFENWWGPQKNLLLEKKLNSKELSSRFSDAQIISHLSEFNLSGKEFLAKGLLGMSGQDFLRFSQDESRKIEHLLSKSSKVLVEPFLHRVKDFSQYHFIDGTEISYENIVNASFQYKGTIIRNLSAPSLESLSFYDQLLPKDWSDFNGLIRELVPFYRSEGAQGFSVDSFTYLDQGGLRIRPVSEVNCRKTMGLLTWELSRKFAGAEGVTILLLGKPRKTKYAFKEIQSLIEPLAWDKKNRKGCLQLSPGDTRFDIFFLSASSTQEGKALVHKLRELLPDSELPIQI